MERIVFLCFVGGDVQVCSKEMEIIIKRVHKKEQNRIYMKSFLRIINNYYSNITKNSLACKFIRLPRAKQNKVKTLKIAI